MDAILLTTAAQEAELLRQKEHCEVGCRVTGGVGCLEERKCYGMKDGGGMPCGGPETQGVSCGGSEMGSASYGDAET